MPNDALVTVLLVVAVLLVVDLLLAGGAMTMMGVGAAAGVAAHPLGAIALIALVVLLVSRIV